MSGSSLVSTRRGTSGVLPMRSTTPLMTNETLMYSAYHVEKLFGNGRMGSMSKILLKFMHRVIALNSEVPLFMDYGQTLYSR